MPSLNQKGHLTTHTKRNKTLVQYIPLHNEEQDQQASALNVDTNFHIEIPVFEDYQEVSKEDTIQCYTDGSMMNSQVGAGIFIVDKQMPLREESYHLEPNSTVS